MRTIDLTDLFFGSIITVLVVVMLLSLYQVVTQANDLRACQSYGYIESVHLDETYCVRVDQGDGEIISLAELEGSQ